MHLEGFPGPEPVAIDLHAANRWEAIDELINHLVATHQIKSEHRDEIAASVRKRESSLTTGIGFGLGIPHAQTDLVQEVVAAVGRSKTGIQFDSLDGKPVRLVMLFLIPPKQFQKYLPLLANIARRLHGAGVHHG